MSGGHFDYVQDRLLDVIESIQTEVAKNRVPYPKTGIQEWKLEYGGQRWEPEVIKEFKKGIKAIQKAYVYIQRIDWLLSGDDGEENFHKRLKEDLRELKC